MCAQDAIYSGSVALAVQFSKKERILGFSEVTSCVSPFYDSRGDCIGIIVQSHSGYFYGGKGCGGQG